MTFDISIIYLILFIFQIKCEFVLHVIPFFNTKRKKLQFYNYKKQNVVQLIHDTSFSRATNDTSLPCPGRPRLDAAPIVCSVVRMTLQKITINRHTHTLTHTHTHKHTHTHTLSHTHAYHTRTHTHIHTLLTKKHNGKRPNPPIVCRRGGSWLSALPCRPGRRPHLSDSLG